MKASNNLILSLTGLAVKFYMLIAVVWSKSNELYTSARSTIITSSTAHPASQAHS